MMRRQKRRLPPKPMPPKGYMWHPNAYGGVVSIKWVESCAKDNMEEYDDWPKEIRDRIKERGF